jgi:hypothetical protein
MSKGLIYLAITIGGGIGGYVPVLLFHAGGLSFASIIGSLLGSVAGIYIVYKLDLGD